MIKVRADGEGRDAGGRRAARAGRRQVRGRAVRFTGIGVSPGIGLGPAFVLVPEELAVREFVVPEEGVEREIAFFERALATAQRDVAQLRDGIAAELGDRDAAIYDAHLMMLDDPELHRAVVDAIRSTHRNAGVVFRDYMAQIAARLERVEDEYLRERRADVLDVERRVLRYLVGGGQRGLDLPEALRRDRPRARPERRGAARPRPRARPW